MIKTITPGNSWLTIRRLCYAASFLFFAAIITFCCFYLLSGHARLAQWYVGLNGCFYKSTTWSTDFFTPGIKSDGNMYCIFALIISLFAIACFRRPLKKKSESSGPLAPVVFDTSDIVPLILLLGSVLFLWLWGNSAALPAYDEVFSARNAAGIHPFQCISYYMLPNNHLLYNFLNNILFHFSPDKVITGRFISLFAYALFTVSVFFCFKQVVRNKWPSLLVSITLASQFFVWGFSFQARGYELYLLAECGSLVSLFSYLLTAQKKWLYVNLLVTALGYFIMPSLFYFHAAELVFMVLYQLICRRKQGLFWKCQVAAVLLAFLFYLPALCFSGLESVTHNSYVASMAKYKTTAAFITAMLPFFKSYISHIFSDMRLGSFNLGLALYFLPLVLLAARRNKKLFLFGLFYLSLALTAFTAICVMKRMPFERNLVGHYSVALAGVILVAWWLGRILAYKRTAAVLKWLFFPAVSALFTFHFVSTNQAFLKSTLYEYDVNSGYNFKKDFLSKIPAGSTVACSDEEFYSAYVCTKNGCIVSDCPAGNEDYYLMDVFEQAPPGLIDRYTLVSNVWGYLIYRRK